MHSVSQPEGGFNPHGFVSGAISYAVAAGLPVALALPIEPPYLHLPIDDERRKGSGKTPATISPAGEWLPAKGWTATGTFHPEVLRDAGQAGCNVGAVLGVPIDGVHLVAIDIDLADGHMAECDIILDAVRSEFGGEALPYRIAKLGRALILVNLEGMLPSRKTVWRINRNGQDIGKIELLATGQQCVIGGVHWTGKPITWYCDAMRGKTWPVPPVKEIGFPLFQDFPAVLRTIEMVWQGMRPQGYEFPLISSGSGAGTSTEDISKAPNWLTLDFLVDAVTRLENGAQVDRDKYVEVAQRIAGARRGIVAHHGSLSPEQEDRLADAFASWASKYVVAHQRDQHGEELAKWHNDWIKRGDNTGWQQLVACARSLGVDLPNEAAQVEFGAEPAPPGYKLDQDPEVHAPDRNHALTEDVLASDFAFQHARHLRYVKLWGKWYMWDGKVWRRDETGVAFRLMRALCRETAIRLDTPVQPLLATTISSLRSRTKSFNTLSFAEVDKRLAMEADKWDLDPWLLNTPGGVVDLRTGKMQDHDPTFYMTKTTTVTPGGECPIWLAFLDKITGGDKELQCYLQRAIGYCLTGITRDHALFFGYGTGGNGKSTLLNMVAKIMGDYATTATMESFTASKMERHTTDLAMLRGARLVTAEETEEGQRWAESKIKALTSGNPITARFMRQDNFTYVPQFKLFITGNHKPGLRSVDPAIRRRMNMIPFAVSIPAGEVDKCLSEKLEAEAGGILKWMVDGCLAWQRDGLQPPEVVVNATENYLDNQDTMAAWIEERCLTGAGRWAPIAELYRSWKSWCDMNGEFVVPQKQFGDMLEARGYQRKAKAIARGIDGISMKPASESSLMTLVA